MQLKTAAIEFQTLGHRVLPFLKVIGDADVYCFDAEGRIQRGLTKKILSRHTTALSSMCSDMNFWSLRRDENEKSQNKAVQPTRQSRVADLFVRLEARDSVYVSSGFLFHSVTIGPRSDAHRLRL
jgi:hypothetical protein